MIKKNFKCCTINSIFREDLRKSFGRSNTISSASADEPAGEEKEGASQVDNFLS